MYNREYFCLDCNHRWSEISEDTLLECPKCQGDAFRIEWQARAYD